MIGESVRRLSTEFRERHSKIPWQQIAGMRNILIHQYDAVDLDEVWKTLEIDLPKLIADIRQIRRPLP